MQVKMSEGITLINKVRGLRKYSFSELLRRVFEHLIYSEKWMGEYCLTVKDCIAPGVDNPYDIEFLMADEYADVLAMNPYLSLLDVNEFKQCESVCVVTKYDNRVVGSVWLVRTSPYMSDLKRRIFIRDNEYYICRSYVHPEYRGKHILSHMVYKFAIDYASSDEKIRSYIFNWNVASITSFARVGFQHIRDVGFIMLLGFKWRRYR